MGEPLIILGSSARAAAGSAVAAGYEVWCVDRRGDRDLRELAPGSGVRVVGGEYYPQGILKLLEDAPSDAKVLLAGGLDGEVDLLKAIGFEHEFLTSSAEAVRKVRWPTALATIPKMPGLRRCKTVTTISFMRRLWRLAFGSFGKMKYLLKPQNSYGGQGIRWWSPGDPIDATHYLQQYVRGMPISVVYHCDGWSSILLGATEQLIGEPCFGASEFAYCGSIGPLQVSEATREAMSRLGVVLTQRFDLRGVFGVDLIMDFKGDLWPVEVNPRYTASVELVEKITGIHALSPGDGSRKNKPSRAAVQGKAVVYAKLAGGAGETGGVPDLYELFGKDEVADVPGAGKVVRDGAAVCTVFASGVSRDDCFNKLKAMAGRVYTAMSER
jgi:uncharacterized protein